jgi:hypothetical protein
MRALALLGVVAAALGAASTAAAADRVVDRGIVQTVSSERLVLRALDGVDVEVRLGPLTRFRLNGRAAAVGDLRPGFVAEVVHYGTRPALRVRAFGRVATTTERGRLVGVHDAWLVLRGSSGRVRVPVTAATLVRRRGRLVAVRVLRVGMRVEVVRAADGSAEVVRILRVRA